MGTDRPRWQQLLVPLARLYGAGLGALIGGLARLLGDRARPLGPGPMLGVLVGLHVLMVGVWIGPLGVLAACVAGGITALVTSLTTTHRGLDDAERRVVRQVFGDADWLERVVLTDLDGVADRAFTVPGIDGRIYCNLGSDFADPLGPGSGSYPAAGQLLVHEVVHAWQISRATSPSAFLADALAVQARYSLGENVYGVRGLLSAEGDLDDPVGTFVVSTLEQQATLVDRWFAGQDSPTRTPMDPRSPVAAVVAHLRTPHGQQGKAV